MARRMLAVRTVVRALMSAEVRALMGVVVRRR